MKKITLYLLMIYWIFLPLLLQAQRDTINPSKRQKPVFEKSQEVEDNKPKFSDYISITAGGISLFAFVFSYISFREQMNKARREELRNIIEKLLAVRVGFNQKTLKMRNDQEKFLASTFDFRLGNIYLSSAEALAERISKYVSTPEYLVIGEENEWQSDFFQARKYYRLALKAAKNESIANKVIARRYYAGSFYFNEPHRNLEEGRKIFQKAIDVIYEENTKINRILHFKWLFQNKSIKNIQNKDKPLLNDPYLIYTQVATYRMWSEKELQCGEREEAFKHLMSSKLLVEQLPEWYMYKNTEVRHLSNQIKFIGDAYLNEKEYPKALEYYKEAINLMNHPIFNDDSCNFLRATIYKSQALIYFYWEKDNIKYETLLKNAMNYLEKLSEEFQTKIQEIEIIKNMLNIKQSF